MCHYTVIKQEFINSAWVSLPFLLVCALHALKQLYLHCQLC